MNLETAKALAKLLDNQFSILGVKFGLDPVLDLIPGLGDVLGLLLSILIIKVGIDNGLPQEKIVQMVGNIVIDFIVGAVPVVGAVADVFYKSNQRNIKIIENYLNSKKIENVEEGEIVNDSRSQ